MRSRKATGETKLDGIPSNALCALVVAAIQQYLPPHELAVLEAAEESERATLASRVVDRLAEELT